MSQSDRFSRTTPGYAKKEELKVLREKQIGSLGSQTTCKTTPLVKKAQPIRATLKNKVTNENKSQTVSSKLPFRSTPMAKALLSKTKPNASAHLSAHQNESKLNTPVNRNIRSVFGSAAKQDSNSKDNSGRKASSRGVASNRHNACITTPSNRSYLSASINSSSKVNRSPNYQNPIVNGHDYSAIMGRKAELGYSGIGYVVEYDCSEEELKSVHVTRGLWRIKTCAITPNKNSIVHKFGVPTFATRLDVEASAAGNTTPGKSIFQNLNWDNPLKSSGILKNEPKAMRSLYLSEEYMNNSTAQCLDLETSHNKISKKSLRWADILEEQHSLDLIEEKQSPAIASPYVLTPKHGKPFDKNLLTGSLGSGSSSSNGVEIGFKINKKLRRSLSMNDINDIIITGDEEEEKNESFTNFQRVQLNYNSPVIQKPAINLNETFELETPSSLLISQRTITNRVKSEQVETNPTNSMDYELVMPVMESSSGNSKDNNADNSLNELMIPFSLSSHDRTLEEVEQTKTDDKKLDIPYEKSQLINNLQNYAVGMKAGLACLHLNDIEEKLLVDPSEYMKITNLVNDMEKSLKIIKEKLSFQ